MSRGCFLDSSRASSSSESEEGEISSNSGDSTRKERPKRNSKKEKRKGHHKTCGKERRRRRGSGSSHGSHCSSGSDSDVEHERFKMAIEEMTRKQEHPARLHPELWFNELGQVRLNFPYLAVIWIFLDERRPIVSMHLESQANGDCSFDLSWRTGLYFWF